MALISIENISCDTLLGIWKKEEELEVLESVFELNNIEKADYSKINNEGRKKEWILVRVLLTEILQQRNTILHNKNGKPFIQNSEYNISVSHSRNFVCIIASKTEFAGVDVEQIADRVEKVKHKFLNSDELEWCTSLELQTTCWSAKEAIFKLHEKDLDFHDMLVSPFELMGESGRLKTSVIKKDKEASYVVNYRRIENDIITYTLSKTSIGQ